MARTRKTTGAGDGAVTPLALLLPYQRDWVSDSARFKIGLWARQTGKSFSTACEAVMDCLVRKTTWVCLSAGERQALEWMMKAREWSEAFEVALEGVIEDRDGQETLLKSAEIKWPNGSRLVAIPANPATARGYSANLVLDEFAFHENPDAIWRAIYPSISNPLKGLLRIRIVSTPNGMGNRFHDLWQKALPFGSDELAAALDAGKRGTWSAHRVDIHRAVELGLPLDIDELREGLADPEGWAQEYECEFLDAAAVLLPYELIAKCESPEATTSVPAEFWHPMMRTGALYMGVDFGRKRNLTVAWTSEMLGDVLQTRDVLELRDTDTPTQVELLRPRIASARRVCVDYTGPGVGLGDYLAREFGEWAPEKDKSGKIELCTFSNTLKVDVFSKLRMAFDQVKVRVPVSRAIREDLHSMHRVTTAQGNVTYRAPMTDDGHADRCTALALCVRAAATGGGGAITDVDGIAIGRSLYRPRRLHMPHISR